MNVTWAPTRLSAGTCGNLVPHLATAPLHISIAWGRRERAGLARNHQSRIPFDSESCGIREIASH